MSRGGSPSSVSLRAVAPDAQFIGCDDIAVHDVSVDSRCIRDGQVFVAVRGRRMDGHAHAAEAVCRGASSVIVDHPLPELPVPQCVVADTRLAWARLCQAIEGYPAQRLRVVGITGTNGKTTTAMLVRSILESAGHKTGLIGTIEQFDGNVSIPASLTTPGPDVIARLMRRMVEAGCTHAVMEVSSHALDQHRVAGISFDVAVFTNLTQDHLDYHDNLAAYRAAKSRLFCELSTSACAVLNADDSASHDYARCCPGRIVTYGVRARAGFSAHDVQLSLSGSRFTLRGPAGEQAIDTHLVGEHNVYNCLAASAVGHELGVAGDHIAAGLARIEHVRGRLEPVQCGQPFHVFVDYAHTPDAIESVLRCLKAVSSGRILCLFGAGGDRDRTKRPLMARAAESLADLVVVTSDNPRTEEPQRIIADIAGGFSRIHALAIEPDRRSAIELILAVAQPGDCVLLAGKGHEDYQLVGNDRLQFDDRQVAADWLTERYGTGGTHGAGTEKRHFGLARRFIACGA